MVGGEYRLIANTYEQAIRNKVKAVASGES